ncbi:hypothetical protein SAMN06265379_1028 [Saccharicrinis carchari]|uniref:Uncharacterized protein n=1 Tax=Saccharicrinis carchari TaxID=1168039 RepID=A0A521BQX7_SACCC|nr:hypothetical protein [Saccharicrinis carchari]SMO49556.1 hypothetical protein SAMN06265379_1028 [Saccharicrinis carchari]
MKKLLKPASIAFYLLMFVLFFIVGVYVPILIGAGKNQMLAGGAIILGWGVMFAGIAFIASFFIVYYVPHKIIVKLNWLFLILLAISYGITHLRYLQRNKKRQQEQRETGQPQKKPTQPILYQTTGINGTTMSVTSTAEATNNPN